MAVQCLSTPIQTIQPAHACKINESERCPLPTPWRLNTGPVPMVHGLGETHGAPSTAYHAHAPPKRALAGDKWIRQSTQRVIWGRGGVPRQAVTKLSPRLSSDVGAAPLGLSAWLQFLVHAPSKSLCAGGLVHLKPLWAWSSVIRVTPAPLPEAPRPRPTCQTHPCTQPQALLSPTTIAASLPGVCTQPPP